MTLLRAKGLGKRYKRAWALRGCTLDIERGHVTALVGPNGAGKSTLLNMASGMLEPTTGTIEVCGGVPGSGPAQLAKVGYVAQNTPVYSGLTVVEHLRLGAALNPGWDDALATARIRRTGLDPAKQAGKLSGGQRAQLALTLGIAKRPELLLLDEPVAALDPLARREFLADLMAAVAEHGLSVVLSSHLVADLERVCDHLVVLVDSQVRITGDVEDLLATHHRLTGPRRDLDTLPADQQVVSASHTDRQTTVVVRTSAPGAQHASFTDIGLFSDQFGLDLGADVSSARVQTITRAYVGAFLDQSLRGISRPLLERPSADYPEVLFCR